MYSGITGKEFKADIYLGVVYYQRLRHMVGDKWQVRTEGPVDSVTRQPIKVRDSDSRIYFSMLITFFARVVNEAVVSVSVRWSVMRFWLTVHPSSFKIDS